MTRSTVTLTPGAEVPGVGAAAELAAVELLRDTLGAQPVWPSDRRRFARRAQRQQAKTVPAGMARIRRPDFPEWVRHIRSAAGCAYPIRLAGRLWEIDTATGRVLSARHTETMPDGTLYVPCGNRRAVVCPSCAETYRADAFHLVRSGLLGGKGVPDTVTTHPTVFATLAAPSFGPVHACWKTRTGTPGVRLCRPRRTPETCPHGITYTCTDKHDPDDPIVGQPFCLDCYDHDGHVVFNAMAGELWRYTTMALNREITRLGKRYGVNLRCSYAKVGEFQRRGIVHFHALIRIDAYDRKDPTRTPLQPPAGVTAGLLELVVRNTACAVAYTTPAHPQRPEGWRLTWGHKGVDVRQVRLTVRDVDDHGEITDTAVAGYLAKYATKATETAGHASARLRYDTVGDYADPTTHIGRLIGACWDLGACPYSVHDKQARAEWSAGFGRLRRWAHMLGFGGHFLTKSRRYSTTFAALRHARRAWNRAHAVEHYGPDTTSTETSDDTTLIVNELAFIGTGWRTLADAELANTIAAKARERRRIAREELGSYHATPRSERRCMS